METEDIQARMKQDKHSQEHSKRELRETKSS
jgi:hypothetical protein